MGKYAIFLVLALTFSLLTYSYALRNSIFLSNQRNIDSYSYNQAQNIAQSALMVTVNIIRSGDDPNFRPADGNSYYYPGVDSYEQWAEMEGEYSIELTNDGDGTIHIISTGKFEEYTYSVRAGVNTQSFQDWDPAIVDKAIHADSNIDMGNSSVDYGDVSLNSALSNFDSNPQASIAGDLYIYDTEQEPGVIESGNGNSGSGNSGRGNSGGGNSSVSNETYNMSERIDHPDPHFPNFPVGNISRTVNDDNRSMGPLNYENYFFESFTTNNMTLDVGDQNRELHVRDLDLSGGLDITGDGNLEIYVENSINLGNGTINNSGLPQNLTIYYKGQQDINYTGNGSFTGTLFAEHENVGIKIAGTPSFTGNILSYGNRVELLGTPAAASLVYAPHAEVTIGGSAGSFEGAIVSDSFSANGRPVVTYNPDFTSTFPELDLIIDSEYQLTYWY